MFLPVGRPEKKRVESEINMDVWIVLHRKGFDFAPRIREWLEGLVALDMAAMGITDFEQKLRENRAKSHPI